MLLVKTYLDKSDVHGIGLFAAENISKGTVIWEFQAGFDTIIPIDIYKNLPLEGKAFMDTYAYLSPHFSGGYVVCIDNARFINHADFPNTDDSKGKTIAIRDIQKGEEILSNYNLFCLEKN